MGSKMKTAIAKYMYVTHKYNDKIIPAMRIFKKKINPFNRVGLTWRRSCRLMKKRTIVLLKRKQQWPSGAGIMKKMKKLVSQ